MKTIEEINEQIDELIKERDAIFGFLDQEGLNFEERKPKYDRLFEILNDLYNLDTQIKDILNGTAKEILEFVLKST